jgi:hypothetical protein
MHKISLSGKISAYEQDGCLVILLSHGEERVERIAEKEANMNPRAEDVMVALVHISASQETYLACTRNGNCSEVDEERAA